MAQKQSSIEHLKDGVVTHGGSTSHAMAYLESQNWGFHTEKSVEISLEFNKAFPKCL
jgi:pyrroline-5-carboxylate reductase